MVRPVDQGSPGRIVVAGASTVAALVLLFGYSTSTGGGTHAKSSVIAAAGSTSGTSSSAGTSTSTASGTTYAGAVAQTRWGPVQVQITVSGNKVVAAGVLQVPSGNGRDQEINAYAVPILNTEAVQAGSAQIDTVSGATVTSDGYLQSLQSALDAAHLP